MNINSDSIIAEYSPSNNKNSSYIFSYSSDGLNIELMEFKDNAWAHIDFFPEILEKK